MANHRFLIVANPRSGTTWLLTSLGSLPDCFADYEFKWNIAYQGIVHRIIPPGQQTCDRLLEEMRNGHPVVGSKLVLDARPYAPQELEELSATIGPETKIIHLYRDYFECIISNWNPFGKRAELTRTYEGRAINEAAKHAPSINRLSDELSSLAHNIRQSLSQKAKAKKQHTYQSLTDGIKKIFYLCLGGRIYIPPPVFYQECLHRFTVDLWAMTLQKTHAYTAVSYHAIPTAFPRLARFVGSRATSQTIATIIANPVTKKIIQTPYAKLVVNIADLRHIADRFNQARDLASNLLSQPSLYA